MSELGAHWRRLSPWVRDGVLATAVTVVGQVELLLLAEQVEGPRLLQHATFAVMTGSLLLRRLRPVTAAAAVSAGLALQTLLGDAPAVAGFLAVLIVTYSVAQYADRRRDALLGLLAVLASIAVYPFVNADVSVADEIANALIPTLVWVFARLARERLDRAVRAEREAAEHRERAREADAARAAALAAERRRIAREMHDVVGHGVTLMLLHAGAVQAGPAARDPQTAAALDVVLDAGRTALDDLHRLLRVLRDDTAGDGVPGTLADVERLAEAASAELVVDGRPGQVSAAVEATAHRVVQESLTNVRRHAPGAAVRVLLRWTDAALEIEVTDDGRTPAGDHEPGFGLLGMRERVALFDGRVSAGPRPDGPGWRTVAVLPLPVPVAA
ncbi:sensor histidine kinase [Geodermatophilus chilensis]|uniref:sensor histidine kinase n=1 Tax=Geodermatophilus chilensis TaxID=2035835 RepID=UPI000C269B63|nr:histidine kinase [Geodermatophilus chilensis]